MKVLDHGYLRYVEHWGSDERIIEAARMSTGKGFLGWVRLIRCTVCGREVECENKPAFCNVGSCLNSPMVEVHPGDRKLLRFLWENKHATPFEMAGLTVEVQAPIMVFREWHRHRTQCLGPDTLIHFDAPKSRDNRRFVYKMRIEDVWRKWQPTVRADRPGRQTNAFFPRSRIQAMQLRHLDEGEMEIGKTHIVDVVRGEAKPMLRVTTTSGRTITLTREHQVLTRTGWMQLGQALQQREMLTLEGTTRGKTMRWEVPPIDESAERWVPVFGWVGLYEVSSEGRVRRVGCQPRKTPEGAQGYNVVSLNRPGVQTLRTVHSIVLESFVGSCPEGHETRHLNDNRADNRLSNLEWGTAKQNAADRVVSDRQQRLVPVYEEVVTVEDAGFLPSFDIAVEGPWHNFIADGFVVHNSYNEMSARYTPLPDVNYIPSVERLMIGSDGKNKQAGTVAGADVLTEQQAIRFQRELEDMYQQQERLYQWALQAGVPKELARVHLGVGRYSRMRASTDLRNWLAFLTLRMASSAQWEIRQFANEVGKLIAELFPRTWELFVGGSHG